MKNKKKLNPCYSNVELKIFCFQIMSKLQIHLMVPSFHKSSQSTNDVTLKISFFASEHNKKDEIERKIGMDWILGQNQLKSSFSCKLKFISTTNSMWQIRSHGNNENLVVNFF